MSQNRWKIVESLWVDRSDFINGLNLILLIYGLAILVTEVVYPDIEGWLKFVRFYCITVIAMWFVKRSVQKLPKTPVRVDSQPPNSSAS